VNFTEIYVFSLTLAALLFVTNKRILSCEFRERLECSDFFFFVIFIVTMWRIDGIDWENYQNRFDTDFFDLYAPIYSLLVLAFRLLDLGYIHFNIFHATIGLFFLRAVARKFNVSVSLTMLLLLSNPLVMRDFSQSRVGLGVLLFFAALSLPKQWQRLSLSLIAVLVHISVLPLLATQIFCVLVLRHKWGLDKVVLVFSISVVVILLLFNFLLNHYWIDLPHIAAYANRPTDRLGFAIRPIDLVVLTSVVFAYLLYLFSRFNGYLGRSITEEVMISYLSAIGACCVLILTATFSTFAYRISNVMLSLYPILLIWIYRELRASNPNYDMLLNLMSKPMLVILPSIAIYTTGAQDVLASFKFYKGIL